MSSLCNSRVQPTTAATPFLTCARRADSGNRKWSKDDDQGTESTSSSGNATRKIASRDALDGSQGLNPATSRASHEAESRRDEHVPHSICVWDLLQPYVHSTDAYLRPKPWPSCQSICVHIGYAAPAFNYLADQQPAKSTIFTIFQ